jgi:hypothetical protein
MTEIFWFIAWAAVFLAWIFAMLAARNFKRQRDHWRVIANYRAELYNPQKGRKQSGNPKARIQQAL